MSIWSLKRVGVPDYAQLPQTLLGLSAQSHMRPRGACWRHNSLRSSSHLNVVTRTIEIQQHCLGSLGGLQTVRALKSFPSERFIVKCRAMDLPAGCCSVEIGDSRTLSYLKVASQMSASVLVAVKYIVRLSGATDDLVSICLDSKESSTLERPVTESTSLRSLPDSIIRRWLSLSHTGWPVCFRLMIVRLSRS